MTNPNPYFENLTNNYLFARIEKRVADYRKQHPKSRLVNLGIGDVTRPLPKVVIEAMHKAVDEMGQSASFKGYGPAHGYNFLKKAIAHNDYRARGAKIDEDEIFISDGCKSDSGNIGELFAKENRVAICDPVYPVYVDATVMDGRAGTPDSVTGNFSRISWLQCHEEDGFVPKVANLVKKNERPNLIYLCFPNNPTGAVISRRQLQAWVDFANASGAVILYDGAYEAFIQDDVVHSIYEIDGAKTCAIELRSFSKTAGFTGLRCGYTVIPRELVRGEASFKALWARRQATKFNGVSYVTQRAAEAVYFDEGQKQIKKTIAFYMENARLLREALDAAGFRVSGGINAPYLWIKTPASYDSWAYFDHLLDEHAMVVTPGVGFGPGGEGYFRLTSFGTREATKEACKRIEQLPT